MALKEGNLRSSLRNVSVGPSIPESVITRHKIDDTAGTVTDSIGTWDMSVNGATWNSDQNSVGGYNLSLATDDNLDGGDVVTPDQLSVCFWIRLDNSADGNVEYLWDFGVHGSNDQGAAIIKRDGSSGLLNASDGEIRVTIGSGGLTTGFIPNANTWYHFAMTYASDGTTTFYVDGSQQAQTSVGDGIVGDSSRPLRIGEASFGGNNLFGDVDDHHIANSDLTQTEVQDIKSLSPRG